MLPKELIRAIPAARVALERKAGGSCQNIGRAALAPIPAITRPPITSQALVGARDRQAEPGGGHQQRNAQVPAALAQAVGGTADEDHEGAAGEIGHRAEHADAAVWAMPAPWIRLGIQNAMVFTASITAK